MLDTIVAEIENYLSEKEELFKTLFIKGGHNLICANTGLGKTSLALNIAQKTEYSILLSPTRVIVDQMIASAKKKGLEVVEATDVDTWSFGEIDYGTSKIWIGTFSALMHVQPNWNAAKYVFLDEIHFLLDLSLFGKETALEVWNLIQNVDQYPETTFVSLTANEELVMPLHEILNLDKIFLAKTEKWRLSPNKLVIYPTFNGMNNIDFILHYCANNVRSNEKVLCVVKSYNELDRIREAASRLPNKMEVISAKDKKTSETYWSICLYGEYPAEIRLVVATTWISLGASILDPDVRHVISTFPNYSLTKQILSRVRKGSVNVAIMQLRTSKRRFSGNAGKLYRLAIDSQKDSSFFSEVYTEYKGERIWFPLPVISETYQEEQELLFTDLYKLKKYMQKNLDCQVNIMWEALLPLTDKTIKASQLPRLVQLADSQQFPVRTQKQLISALRLTVEE